MKKLFLKIKSIDYRHFLVVALLLAFYAYVGFQFPRIWERLFLSLKVFLSDIIYYFNALGDRSTAVLPGQVYDLIGTGDFVLPQEFTTFAADFKIYFSMLFSLDFLDSSWHETIDNLYYYIQFFNLIVMVYCVTTLLFLNYYEPKYMKRGKEEVERPVGYESRSVKVYKWFESHVMKPVWHWFVEFLDFWKFYSVYWKIGLVALIAYVNGFAIIVDLLSWYVTFIASADFVLIYKTVVMILTDLWPFLIKVPLVVYLALTLYIIDKISESIGYKVLEHGIAYVIGFLKEKAGLALLKIGRMGKGKTKLAIFDTLLKERLFRDQCLEVMTEVAVLFPHFPYRNLERDIVERMDRKEGADGRLFNRRLVQLFVKAKKEAFEEDPKMENIWGYDFVHYNNSMYNALHEEEIFHALSDYAECFFMYRMTCPLVVGNLPIKMDGQQINYGHFPVWDYDWLHRDYHEGATKFRRSKDIDYDELRLGKKVDPATDKSFVLDGCVAVIDEVGKERPNQLETAEIKKSEEVANVKNDRFNDSVKMIRSRCTVRHRTFFSLHFTEQRDDSLPADLRQLCDSVMDCNAIDVENKIARPFFNIRPTFIQWFVGQFKERWVRFNLFRDDTTLPGYVFGDLVSRMNIWLERKVNTFGYEVYTLPVYEGNMDPKTMYEQKYFVPRKIVYADRYTSDTHRLYYNEGFEQSKIGFMDLHEFEDNAATVEEFLAQHSYFMTDILKLIDSLKKKTSENTSETKDLKDPAETFVL